MKKTILLRIVLGTQEDSMYLAIVKSPKCSCVGEGIFTPLILSLIHCKVLQCALQSLSNGLIVNSCSSLYGNIQLRGVS